MKIRILVGIKERSRKKTDGRPPSHIYKLRRSTIDNNEDNATQDDAAGEIEQPEEGQGGRPSDIRSVA